MEFAAIGFILTLLTAAIGLVSKYHASMEKLKQELSDRIEAVEKEMHSHDTQRLVRQTEVKATLVRHDQWLSSIQQVSNNTRGEVTAIAAKVAAEQKLLFKERDELISRLYAKVGNIELFLAKEFSFKIRNSDRSE